MSGGRAAEGAGRVDLLLAGALWIGRRVLRVAPRDFADRFGRELLDDLGATVTEVAAARGQGAALWTAICEVGDLSRVVFRLRRRKGHRVWRTLPRLAVVAVFTILLPFPVPWAQGTVHFDAEDPAGVFTVTIQSGAVSAATVDGQTIPFGRIVQRGDSIRLLSVSGDPLVELRFDAEQASIAWEARTPIAESQS